VAIVIGQMSHRHTNGKAAVIVSVSDSPIANAAPAACDSLMVSF
jgi:hypothetical protein